MPEYMLSVIENPKSLTSEVYRTLRTNIQFVSIDKVIKSILFTSALPREGKSSVVANLAISMSLADKKVLIIDADLRKPSQHKIFGLPNFFGLTTTLVSNVSVFEHIVETKHKGLDVLPAGPNPPNPAELLDSKRMKQILHELTQAYEFVLVDSPPVIAVTDAAILAQSVDGVILVLAANGVKREYALEAKARLKKVDAKLLGVILNKVKLQSKEQNYYSYYG